MSRIRAEECEQLDLEWYGVDKQGNIAVFCSAGEGNLPEFVCEDAERTDELIDYFANIGKITDSVLVFLQEERSAQTARDFSDKGLYYFDANDGTSPEICTAQKYYIKHSYPQKALKYEQLPQAMRDLLKHNFMEIENFSFVNMIHVKHAYV